MVTKYYYAGGRRVAMRTGGQTYYLFPDHLGSTHVIDTGSGNPTGTLLYKPWGETRHTTGTPITTWRFTGQREDATIGLYFYNARFYDPVLGRFTQPDTIVPDPGDPQVLNRYSYVLNNPVQYTDPTGHNPACAAWMGGGPLGGIAALVCEVGSAIASSWSQVQALAVELQLLAPLAAELPAAMDSNVDPSAAPSNAGNTGDPGGLDPRDPISDCIVQAHARFASVGREIVPDILNTYGGEVGRSEQIPETFAGRRVTTLGRFAQTQPAGEADARILDVPNWSTRLNSDWIQEAIRNGDVFRLVTDVADDTTSLLNQKHGISVFARELDALLRAGYIRIRDHLVRPPGS